MGSLPVENGHSEQWLGKGRPIRVAVIGAGISGIAAVKLFKEQLKHLPVSLVLYEKNIDVGGTWLENRYPGCSCDIPAHGYTFSWEGNPRWSGTYVGAEEIFDFYKSRAIKYGVFDYLKLGHRVQKATWSDQKGKWQLDIEDLNRKELFTDEVEVLINASGFLNSWKWPEIPGLANFTGIKVHSAHWDESISFSNKTVAVIGSGSSAIQIVPRLQKEVKHLFSFNRSPTWITPELGSEHAPQGRESRYSEKQKDLWEQDPTQLLQHRKKIESTMNAGFELQLSKSDLQRELYDTCSKNMALTLSKKPGLSEKLIPKFAVGCRRLTPGDGYLEALVSDNVTVVTEAIVGATGDGLETINGEKFNVDIIVCATGFDTSYRPSFNVIGKKGKDLRDVWAEKPRSYLSIGAAGFPNYFMATGPNFPLANGGLIPCIESTVRYAFDAVAKIQKQGVKCLYPKQAAVDEFQLYKDAMMKNLVWTSGCRSWYKNGNSTGEVWGPWPGSSLHFKELLSQPRWEDYEIEYLSESRFDYLGNGRTELEASGGDLAWYLT